MNEKLKFFNKGKAAKLLALTVPALLLAPFVAAQVSPHQVSPVVTAEAAVDTGSAGGGYGGLSNSGRAHWVKVDKPWLMRRSETTVGNVDKWSLHNKPACKATNDVWILIPGATFDKWHSAYHSDGWRFSLWAPDTAAGAKANHESVINEMVNNGGVGLSWNDAKNRLSRQNMVCISTDNRPDQVNWDYYVREELPRTANFTKNEPYRLNVTVSPQPIEGKLDPIGKQNLNTQSSSETTNFARVWDELLTKSRESGYENQNIYNDFLSKFDEAIRQDATRERKQVELNRENLEGMGEGGILNVDEHTYYARSDVSTTTTRYYVERCVAEYKHGQWRNREQGLPCERVNDPHINPHNLPKPPAHWAKNGNVAAAWHHNNNNPHRQNEFTYYTPPQGQWGRTSWEKYKSTITVAHPTQRNTGFWQIISAHCNELGFQQLKAAMGNSLEKLDAGNSGNAISGLYKTQKYDSRPAVLPLGHNHTSLNSAQRETAKLGFYDKECPYQCTAHESFEESTISNDAKFNTSKSDGFFNGKDKPVNANGYFGSILNDKSKHHSGNVDEIFSNSKKTEGNRFEFFRDNEFNNFRVNTWFPIPTDSIIYEGEQAKSTMVTLNPNGTPEVGKEFNMKYIDVARNTGKMDAYGNIDGLPADQWWEIGGPPAPSDTRVGLLNKDSSSSGSLFVKENAKFGTNALVTKNFDTSERYNSPYQSVIPGTVNYFSVKSSWASEVNKPQSVSFNWEYSPIVKSKVPATLGFTAGGNNTLATFKEVGTRVDGRCFSEFGTLEQTKNNKSLMWVTTGSSAKASFTGPAYSDFENRVVALTFVRGTGS